MSQSRLGAVLAWLVALLLPVVLILTAIRLVLFPLYTQLEYRTPGFPADPYGFSLEERLQWSGPAVEYLTNDAGIEFLGDQRFADGSPVYNERELEHMVDVKNVVTAALWVWRVALILLVLLGVWALLGGWNDQYAAGWRRGGWLTLFLIGSVVLFVIIGFGIFFVAFHQVFFEAGTWVFNYSDTLIRLFPERFWRDTFLVVGGITILEALLVLLSVRGRR